MPLISPDDWKNFMSAHPDAHLLQTAHWGRLKAEFGWEPVHLVRDGVGAQVLFRRLPLGFSLAYLPKGPVGGGIEGLLDELDAVCRERRAVVLKWEPDAWEEAGGPPGGFRAGPRPVQPPRTIVIDLEGSEDGLLERMKQKTRYNIRLGQRKGVVVRQSGDLDTFNSLIAETGERDMFGVHTPEYYRRVYDLFHPREMCELLVAEAGGGSASAGIPLAALMVFARGKRAWYLYGASSNEYRNYMPTYVLQWEAMRWARGRGCTEYDLWGVPDEDEATLEAEFTKRGDGLWGVYRFKRGFGGQVRRGAGPWDRVYRPALYRLMEFWTSRS